MKSIDPREKGWLKKYIEYRKYLVAEEKCKTIVEKLSPFDKIDEYLYCVTQPTGLMYGFPLNFHTASYPESSKWANKNKMKILLAESFYSSGMYFYKDDIITKKDTIDVHAELTKSISRFYIDFFPHFSKKQHRKEFEKSKNEIELVEYIIGKRIDIKQKWSKNFWTSFFQNSLLFLDVYYFTEWLNSKKIITNSEFYELHNDIRLTILQIIAAAANANKIIETEERSLYNFFLYSSELAPEKEKEASKYLEQGLTVDDIDLHGIDSWLLKKYFLELATLTIWSDKEVDQNEKEFLRKLNTKLGFENKELENSLIAVESFVVENWQEVHYLQDKQKYRIVGNRLLKNIANLVGEYKSKIAQEITESKELLELLNKSRKTKLSLEEKEKVRLQLIDILKTLPVFAIVAIPGSFLTLPLLFRILPKSVFPTSFKNPNIN